jgi:beta-N-acetylhexosaminidase
MKIFYLIIIYAAFITAQNLQSVNQIFNGSKSKWVEDNLSRMTIEEKAAQLVFPAANGQYVSSDSPEYQRLVDLVQNVKVGGVIFFLSNIYDQAILTNKLQEISDVPLLVSADFERGVAQRAQNATLFPYNMGIGAADDIELTREMGRIIAAEGRALGVHQNYAPVSDINNNPYNPIINVRAFGENVDIVSRLSNAFLVGVQEGKMIATAKHFPGHGNTNVDSHRGLPLIAGLREDLNSIELPPFRKNIESGVISFMVGHLEVPALEPTEKIPSTLSRNIVTGLLREEFGFQGLIVTDAMNMKAITNIYSNSDAAVKALQAGCDVVLMPPDPIEAIDAIVAAVNMGEISEERINYSVRKVLQTKQWVGLDSEKLIDVNNIFNVIGKEEHWNTAKKLAAKSITLVKDDNNLIPLSGSANIKYAHISVLDTRFGGADNYFIRQLRERIPNITTKTLVQGSSSDDYKDALASAGDADFILLSVYLKVRAYEGTLGLEAGQSEFVNELLKLNKPVVLMSHGNPYILAAIPGVKTYLCNYGDTEVSEAALAEAIFGEIDITGKLPISLPDTEYKAGDQLIRKKSGLRNSSQGVNRKVRFAEVDNIVEAAIKDKAFPGGVVLVAKDGEIVYHKAYGKFTYDYTSSSVNLNSIYDLASVSKVIGTTTAAMICVDRKLFSLDDKVSKHIPEFAQNGKDHITIRNLLVHTSGLPAWRKYYEIYSTADEVIADIYASKLEFATGTKMVYSDLGMITVAKIIEKVTGKTLDRFCRDEIFAPLGMLNTYYNPPAPLHSRIPPTEIDNHWRKRLLIGEVHDETAALLGGVAGHAGLFSTAGDLATLLQMLLQKGEYRGIRLIQPETIELFTKRASDLSSRAIGWDTKSEGGSSAGKLFGPRSYGHTGYTGTSVWTDPDQNLFVVFLTNRVHPTRENNKLGNIRPALHNAVVKATEK